LDTIKMDLRDRIRWYGLDRSGSGQRPVGGLLWIWWWTFGLHKILVSCWVAAQLAASQKGLNSVKVD
jgi:hypothetical protein